MKMLYVDDLRLPKQKEIIQIEIARTYEEAIAKLKLVSYDIISLDHDLGEEKTGYDICKFIVENKIQIPTIILHTSNPVGRFNMKQLLERYTNSNIL